MGIGVVSHVAISRQGFSSVMFQISYYKIFPFFNVVRITANYQAPYISITVISTHSIGASAAIHVHNCITAIIHDVKIVVTARVNGLVAVNTGMNLTNLSVHVGCAAPPTTSSPVTDGILLYYYNWTEIKSQRVIVNIDNYVYKSDMSSTTMSCQRALDIILMQSEYSIKNHSI